MLRSVIPAVVLVGVLASGCARWIPEFSAAGYRHRTLELRISAPDGAAPHELVSRDWVLDNYTFVDGAPRELKHGDAWRTTRAYDVTGEGNATTFRDQPIYDLHFHHRRHGGAIWMRAMPLPRGLEETELRVLGRRMVDAMSGSGVVVTDMSDGRLAAEEHRWATRLLAAETIAVDGREAWAGTIEIANVDQLALDPSRSWERARIVLVRTDLVIDLAGVGGAHDCDGRSYGRRQPVTDPEICGAERPRAEPWPVLLVFGYSNMAEDFAEGLIDFEGLVRRAVFDTEATQGIASQVLECMPSEDRVRVVAGESAIVVPWSEDIPSRHCVRRVARQLERGRSYGFRRPIARFTPPAAPTSGGAAITQETEAAPQPAPAAPADAPAPTDVPPPPADVPPPPA